MTGSATSAAGSGPRLGVLDFHPIQYHVPLYRLLAARGVVGLDVRYLRENGNRRAVDPGFGVPVRWNIDLLSGYRSGFGRTGDPAWRTAALVRWLRRHDVVVIHGHSDPQMLLATLACRVLRVPYLLRGDAGPVGPSTGLRRLARSAVARLVVAGCAGGLAVGARNAEFYRKYRAPAVIFAPHSVDNAAFAARPEHSRDAIRASLGLPAGRPVLLFCGKLLPRKRPLDLVAAASRLDLAVSLMFVGDGPLARQVRAALAPGEGVVTGFVNQAELPGFYHAADILVLPSESEPWGLVVNEAMAAGVLPVVSDQVGAATDLVAGLGEVYPCGDIDAMAAALRRALDTLGGTGLRQQIACRVERYGVEATALGFERAARSASAVRRAGQE